ncbi:MAG: transglycosylase SLT domain-containing protein [Nitrospinae bacterium]|nr:transglycosylase SLT domain-containing protein [Nitrospinota bacterium]
MNSRSMAGVSAGGVPILRALFSIALVLICLVAVSAQAQESSGDATSDLLSEFHAANHRLPLASYKLPKAIVFCGEHVPIELWDVKERLEREFLSILSGEPLVILWLKRANRYFPHIESHIRLAGLPDDVKYMTVVESSLNPQARSGAGAVGMWQFIRSTGRSYGMSHTYWLDERRDFEKATDGALRYLKDLFEDFQSWPLALAAYNSGAERVREAMLTQRVVNYYQLALPRETERYVFRIIAAKIILENPAKYGFALEAAELYEPLATTWINLRVRGSKLHLRDVAEAGGTYFRHIKKLNPQLRRDSLPRGVHRIRVPAGAAKDFQANLKAIRQRNRRQTMAALKGRKAVKYRVKKGDSLWAISERYGVTIKALRKWNSIRKGEPIYAGERLLIYIK